MKLIERKPGEIGMIETPKIFTFDIFGINVPVIYVVDYDDSSLLWKTMNTGRTWLEWHKGKGAILNITNWKGKKLGVKERSSGGTEIVFLDKNM